MKKLLITTIIFILLFIFIVPPYNELNNIAIIDSIGIEKTNDNYIVYLREIIPKKSDNGIKYTYKIYKTYTNKLENIESKLQKNVKKKLYLNKVKYLVININNTKLIDKLKINPKSIYHTNNVKDKLKSTL